MQTRTSELQLAKERAEHSEHVKQQFLANMSHEICTPMHAIVGLNDALLRKEHLPGQEAYLKAVAQSSNNLLELVNDILDLSKIEAGRMEKEAVPLDPGELIASLGSLLSPRAEAKGLALRSRIAPEVPGTLIGDPGRFNQVLMNIVGNAIKFTAEGYVSIAVDMEKLPSGQIMLNTAVSDTGIGIAAARLPSIFNEFSQADNSYTRKYGGSGLGLTISKRLTELLGGTLTVESSPGKGSTFTLTIPFTLPPPEKAPATTMDDKPDAPEGLKDLEVLLVEDHALNVMVAREVLSAAIPGVTIDVALNGLEAVEMTATKRYDVILMDVQMPMMDGYEATRIIRAREAGRKPVPIIGVTANVMPTELERCMEAGMNGHLTKPFTREELMEVVGESLFKGR